MADLQDIGMDLSGQDSNPLINAAIDRINRNSANVEIARNIANSAIVTANNARATAENAQQFSEDNLNRIDDLRDRVSGLAPNLGSVFGGTGTNTTTPGINNTTVWGMLQSVWNRISAIRNMFTEASPRIPTVPATVGNNALYWGYDADGNGPGWFVLGRVPQLIVDSGSFTIQGIDSGPSMVSASNLYFERIGDILHIQGHVEFRVESAQNEVGIIIANLSHASDIFDSTPALGMVEIENSNGSIISGNQLASANFDEVGAWGDGTVRFQVNLVSNTVIQFLNFNAVVPLIRRYD